MQILMNKTIVKMIKEIVSLEIDDNTKLSYLEISPKDMNMSMVVLELIFKSK